MSAISASHRAVTCCGDLEGVSVGIGECGDAQLDASEAALPVG